MLFEVLLIDKELREISRSTLINGQKLWLRLTLSVQLIIALMNQRTISTGRWTTCRVGGTIEKEKKKVDNQN